LYPPYPATRLQYVHTQKYVFKPLRKADWKLYVSILELAGPILRPQATSGIFIVQTPKYTHSPHALGPVSSRNISSPVSKKKGHWKD